MPWWLWAVIYVVGWMGTFRRTWLRKTDLRQRWIEKFKVRDNGIFSDRLYPSDIRGRTGNDLAATIVMAFAWPFLVLFLVGKFTMFPRGIRTKFDKEMEQERKLKKAEEDLELAYQILKESHVQPEGGS